MRKRANLLIRLVVAVQRLLVATGKAKIEELNEPLSGTSSAWAPY